MILKRQFFLIIPLSIILLGLLSYNFLNAQWSGPTSAPPNNNVATPINVGNVIQEKRGNFKGNVLLASTSVWSPEYCDEFGNNCWTPGVGVAPPTEGIERVWMDVRVLRNHNTVYENNSGTDIQVCVDTNGAGWIDASSDNISWFSGVTQTDITNCIIIPNNSYYRTRGAAITSWRELRSSDLGPYCNVHFSWNIVGQQRGSTTRQVYGSGTAAIGMNYDHDDWENSPRPRNYTEILSGHSWGGNWRDSSERAEMGYYDAYFYNSNRALIDGYNRHAHIVTTPLPLVEGQTVTITNRGIREIGANSIRLSATVRTCHAR